MGNIRSHGEMTAWCDAMDAAMDVFQTTRSFPAEEKYSLVDQVRRSSRFEAANIAEAWRTRRYEAAFKSKMNDAEAEAGESQTWIEMARSCNYIDADTAKRLDGRYEKIIGQIVVVIRNSMKWTIGT